MESSSLYFNATVVSIVAIAVTSLVYVFCHFVRTRAPQKTRLYGRIQEIPYRAGPKKKIVRIDPFSVTGLDMLRRFEDALANFLYSFCNEVALSRLDSYRIVFTGQQDRGIARHDVDQYKLEYFWILNHLYSNAREYAYLFTATRDKNVKDAVFKLRSSPLSVAELKSALETSKGPPYRVEVIHSLGWQIRNICGELTAEANERENGVHILEGFDSTNKDVRHRIRSSILHTMDKGSNLVEILRTISPNTSKVGYFFHLTYHELYLTSIHHSRRSSRIIIALW